MFPVDLSTKNNGGCNQARILPLGHDKVGTHSSVSRETREHRSKNRTVHGNKRASVT
jgi:hypothetical protein